jgi:hypothetical protein
MSVAVTNARTLKIAAAAGVTDLRADGPGRYIIGSGIHQALIVRQGSAWRIYSPITDAHMPPTLAVALGIAAEHVARSRQLTAVAAAMTDQEIQEALWTPNLDDAFRQRVLAEKAARESRR